MGRSLIYTRKSVVLFLAVLLFGASAQAALIYNIDIGLSSQSLQSGYTALTTALSSGGGSVTIDGDLFQVGGTVAGSRNRGTSGAPTGTDALTADFVFSNSGNLTLTLGSAGGLEAGTWEISVYSADWNIGTDYNQRIGIIEGITETIYGSSVDGSYTGPAITFQFTSDGVSAYSLFIRDAVATGALNDTIHLNGIDLVYIPEPSSLAMLAFGMIGLWLFRKGNR